MRQRKQIKKPDQILLSIVGLMVTAINSMTILSEYDKTHKSNYESIQHVAKIALPIIFTLINMINILRPTSQQPSHCSHITTTLRSAPMGWLLATIADVLGNAGAASVVVPLACGQMIKDPKAPVWEISAAITFTSSQLINSYSFNEHIRTPLGAGFGVLAGLCLLLGAGRSAYLANQASSNDTEQGKDSKVSDQSSYSPIA